MSVKVHNNVDFTFINSIEFHWLLVSLTGVVNFLSGQSYLDKAGGAISGLKNNYFATPVMEIFKSRNKYTMVISIMTLRYLLLDKLHEFLSCFFHKGTRDIDILLCHFGLANSFIQGRRYQWAEVYKQKTSYQRHYFNATGFIALLSYNNINWLVKNSPYVCMTL